MSSEMQLPVEVIEAVMRHMNEDHTADSLLICRGLGGLPDATSARMSGMDADGIDFIAVVDGGSKSVRLPWTERIASRAQIRPEVVLMYRQACEALGIEPRVEEAQH